MKVMKKSTKKLMSLFLVVGMLFTTVSPAFVSNAENPTLEGTYSYDFANGEPRENPILVAGSSSTIAYEKDTTLNQTVAVCTLGGNFGASGSVYVPYELKAGETYDVTMKYKVDKWCAEAFFGSTSSGNGKNGSGLDATSYTTWSKTITLPSDIGDTGYWGISTVVGNKGAKVYIASISITKRIANTTECQLYDFDTNKLNGAPEPVEVEGVKGTKTKAVCYENKKTDTKLDVALTAGKKYKLSFDYKGKGTLWLIAWKNPWGSGEQHLSALTPDTSVVHQINNHVALDSKDAWSRYEVVFTADYAHDQLTIDARFESSFKNNGITESKFYFDNICIEQVEEDKKVDVASTGAVNFNNVSKSKLSDAILAGDKAKVELVNDDVKGQIVQCTLGGGYNKAGMVYFPYSLIGGKQYEVTVTFKTVSGWYTIGYAYGSNGESVKDGFDSTSWKTVTHTFTAPEDKTEMYLGFGDPNQSRHSVLQIASIRIQEYKENTAEYQLYDFDRKWTSATNTFAQRTVVSEPDANDVEQNAFYLQETFSDWVLDAELQKDQEYKISFDYKGTGQLSMYLAKDGGKMVLSNVDCSSNTWGHYETTFTAKATTKDIAIRNDWNVKGTHYIDNLCIVKVEDPKEPEPNELTNITFESFNGSDQVTAFPTGVSTLSEHAKVVASPGGRTGYSLKNSWHTGNNGILKIAYPMQKDHTYQIKVDSYFEKDNGEHEQYNTWFTFYAGNDNDCGGNGSEGGSEVWKTTIITYKAKNNTDFIKLIVNRTNGYFDNIQISDVTPPSVNPDDLTNLTFESYDGSNQTSAYPAGVTVKNSATIATAPGEGHGKYSLKNNWHSNNNGILKIEYPLQKKHIYEITLDYYFENHVDKYASYNPWFTLFADQAKSMGSHYDATYGTWKTVTITFTSDADYNYYELIANTVDAYFDNIKIKDVTPEDTEIDLSKLGNLTFDSFDGVNQITAFPYGATAMSGAKVVSSPGGKTGYSLKNTYHTSNDGILKVEYPLLANHTYEITVDYYFEANDGTHADKDYVPWFVLHTEESCYEGTYTETYGTWKTVTITYSPMKDMPYFKLICNKVNAYFDNIRVTDTTISQDELDALLKETESFEKITFSDFSIADGKYETTKNDIAVSGRRKYSLNETMLCGKIYFTKNTVLTVGGLESGWNGLRFDVKQDGKIYLYWLGKKVEGPYKVFDSERAKTTLTDNWLDFKLSIQITDVDGDGLQDDLKLCVWFNDVLYQNSYIVIPDKAEELGRRLSIACNTAGPYIAVASIPELVKGFDYAYFGLTENWEKELLNTGLSIKIAVGGSKDATPFSGDMTSVMTMVVLMSTMVGAAFVTIHVIRKQRSALEQ